MTQGGGLLQLIAQGKQDVFLTGNPQVTWFKMVYRRYTNFSIESQVIQFDNQADFGRKITCLLPRKGDLLGPLILEVQLPALFDTQGNPLSYTNSVGHALIQELSLEIGEQEIDKQTGEWLEMWSNYTVTEDKRQGWNNMIGKTTGTSQGNAPSSSVNLYGPLTLYIPLRFWFCKNPGLYLPLLALQYHPIRLNITLRPLQQMFVVDSPTTTPCDISAVAANITSFNMYGDYVHLDVEERRRFVANQHEYLIEQVQYTPSISIDPRASTVQIPLEFNHPLRELYWIVQRDAAVNSHQWFNYTNLSIGESSTGSGNSYQNLINTALLKLEGFDRFDIRNADYFRLVQPYQFHTVIPIDDFVYSYSFCFRPEDTQPSGSMNASPIQNIVLQLEMNPTVSPARGHANCRVYGLNHNVLRIVDGFGGLLFRV
jgi:hypothetical protein